MVHKKFITVNGKKYGPYLYANKRVGQKIVTTYHGKNAEKSRFSYFLVGFFVVLILLGAFLLFNKEFYPTSSTGRVVAEIDSSYKYGEMLDGKIIFNLKEGELLPKDSIISISGGNENKVLPLSDFTVDLALAEGNFYSEDTGISGIGEGYGVIGEKKDDTKIEFKLKISKTADLVVSGFEESENNLGGGGSSNGDENSGSSDAVSGSDSSNANVDSSNVEESSEVVSEDNVQSSQIDEQGVDGSDNSDSVESQEEESNDESGSESESEDSSSGDGEGDSGSITGAVISEFEESEERIIDGKIIDGSIVGGEKFSYALDEGESAEILSGSVNINGESAEDSKVNLIVENGEVFATFVDYELEQGFGEEYLGDYFLKIEVNLSKFDFIINGNELVFELKYGEEVITSFIKTLEINESLSVKEINTSLISVKTIRSKIRVGEPVKWVKQVETSDPTNLILELPKEAENIKVEKNINDNLENEVISSQVITGNVINSGAEDGFNFFRNLRNLFSRITGNVVGDIEDENLDGRDDGESTKRVVIEELVDSISVEYYTEAPKKTEREISDGKQVVISASDELNYEDVVAYTELDNLVALDKKNEIKLYWETNEQIEGEYLEVSDVEEENIIYESSSYDNIIEDSIIDDKEESVESLESYVRQEIPFDAYDNDGDGKIDYIEWVVPHLSNQTFSIIYITNAVHLDSDRNFVENIYDLVKERDNVWTNEIPAEDYVRVTFEKDLTAENDITLYARSSFSGAMVEVYGEDSGEKIAVFEGISDDKKYRILLTNLAGEEDTFDLKVVGEGIEFDYIVDPQPFIAITFPQNRSYSYTVDAINYTISDNPGGYCKYTLDLGVTNTTITCGENVTGIGASEGQNIWTVYANDSVGDTNYSTVYFIQDTGAPAIQFDAPTPADWASISRNNTMINVSATDNFLVNVTIYLYNVSGLYNETTTSIGYNFVNISNLRDGVYYFNATASDIASNRVSTATRDVTVDTTFPKISIVYPVNGSNYTTLVSNLNYTVSDTNLETCKYTIDNGVTNTTITCNVNVTPVYSRGYSNTWTVYAKDIAGNENYSTFTFTNDPIVLNACGPLEGSYHAYLLNKSVNSDDTCFTISASNLTFNGGGYSVNYGITASGNGFSVSTEQNVTIQHTFVNKSNAEVATPSNYGFSLTTVSYSLIYNNTIVTNGTSNNYGIYWSTGNNNTISSNQIRTGGTDTLNEGMYLNYLENTTVYGNYINTSAAGSNLGLNFPDGSKNIFVYANVIFSRGTSANNHGVSSAVGSGYIYLLNNTINTNGTATNYGISIVGDHYNIEGNTINSFASTSTGNSSAIYLSGSSLNITITRNIISADGAGGSDSGIYLTSTSPSFNSTISHNTFTKTNGHTFYLDSPGKAYIKLQNNTIQNLASGVQLMITEGTNFTTLLDQYIANYTFAGLGAMFTFNNSAAGSIKFYSLVNGSGINLSNDVQITSNFVYVNDTKKPGMNVSANVTLLGLSTTFTTPQIYRNGTQVCNETTIPSCYNYTSLNAGSVRFNVSFWSNYSIIGAASNTLPNTPSVILNSTDGSNKTAQDLNCYANITDPEANFLNVSVEWYNNSVVKFHIDYNNSYTSGLFFSAPLGNTNTTKGENWTCGIGLYDGSLYGAWGNATKLSVLNSLPNASLTFHSDANATTNRTPTFSWIGSDDDGDSITYYFNSTANSIGSGPLCSESIFELSSVTSFSPSNYLKCFIDNNYQYNWTVRGADSNGNGSWTGFRRINISAVVTISLPTFGVIFGNLAFGTSNDTADNSPPPFTIQNDGNAWVNVSVSGSSLWRTAANPSAYYKFKIDNASSYTNAFTSAGSAFSYTNIPLTAVNGIDRLNFTASKNRAEIDIYVETPGNEPPGFRNSTLSFVSSLAE